MIISVVFLYYPLIYLFYKYFLNVDQVSCPTLGTRDTEMKDNL